MEKRGISHVEVMLSFLIFMGFVIFALYFFSPFNTNRVVESALDYAFREIKQEASVKIESYSVRMDVSNRDPTNHIMYITINSINDPDLGNLKVRVYKSDGSVIKAKRVGNDIYFDVEQISMGDTAKIFATFSFSEDFESYDDGIMPNELVPQLVQIASSNTITVLSEKRIIDLVDNYKSDYDNLKKKFNLPNRVNFGFKLDFDNGDVEDVIAGEVSGIPKGVEVFSRRERVEVLRKSLGNSGGNIEFADLVVRIW